MLSQVSLQEKGTRRKQKTEDGRVKAEAETGWIGPEAEEAAAPEAARGEERILPWRPQSERNPWDSLILDFRSPENKFLLFEATQSVGLRAGQPRTLIHQTSKGRGEDSVFRGTERRTLLMRGARWPARGGERENEGPAEGRV